MSRLIGLPISLLLKKKKQLPTDYLDLRTTAPVWVKWNNPIWISHTIYEKYDKYYLKTNLHS